MLNAVNAVILAFTVILADVQSTWAQETSDHNQRLTQVSLQADLRPAIQYFDPNVKKEREICLPDLINQVNSHFDDWIKARSFLAFRISSKLDPKEYRDFRWLTLNEPIEPHLTKSPPPYVLVKQNEYKVITLKYLALSRPFFVPKLTTYVVPILQQGSVTRDETHNIDTVTISWKPSTSGPVLVTFDAYGSPVSQANLQADNKAALQIEPLESDLSEKLNKIMCTPPKPRQYKMGTLELIP